MGFSCGTSAFLAGSKAQIATASTAMPDTSEIHKSFLLFFSDLGAAVCIPVEPKTFVIAACCAATGLVFGATACGRVGPAEGSTVDPDAAAESAAVLKVLVIDLSASS